jgi:tRNA dimethylallyltransferase
MTDDAIDVSEDIDAITLMGPTATGKTALAIKLAAALNGEIISADSALVYRGMDIGTAKPSPEEMQGIPHHLISVRDPGDPYSAADFREDAVRLTGEIRARGRLPILAGGTMLYFKAFEEGLSGLPETTPEIRSRVNAMIAEQGLPQVRSWLREFDPESWERLSPNDTQRIGRACEVYLMTGRSLTSLIKSQPRPECPFRLKRFALLPDPERRLLRPLIQERFEMMLREGLEEETRRLFLRGDLNPELPALRSVGYRQMWQYLAGEVSFEEMKSRAVIATCQLAKRQMTWIRGWKEPYTVLNMGDPDNLGIMLREIRARGA